MIIFKNKEYKAKQINFKNKKYDNKFKTKDLKHKNSY